MLKAIINGNVVRGFTGFALDVDDDGQMWLKVIPESRLVELQSSEELEAQYGGNAYVRASREVPAVGGSTASGADAGGDVESTAVRPIPEAAEPVVGAGGGEGAAPAKPSSNEGE